MKAAIYARYSSDNQREESIEAQVRAIKEYADRYNYAIVKVYADEARSATTDDRPQFLQMIKDAELKVYDAIIVHKLDRFARNRYDSAFYKRALSKSNIKLISVLENLDDSPESVILESVLEGMAEYYSKNLAREVAKGMKETALQAKHNGGISPLGFDVNEDKTYSINENEAIIIKKIFNLYKNGIGYRKIAELLNSEGYKTKIGRPFSSTSIYDILNNEKYKGTYVFNKRFGKVAGKRNNRKFKDDESIIKIENAMPAIIPCDVFDDIQDRMKNRKQGPRITENKYHLLTGYLECGVCHGSYAGNSYRPGRGGKKYTIYSCVTRKQSKNCTNSSIRQDYLEDFVLDELQERVFSENAIKTIVTGIINFAQQHNTDSAKELKYIEDSLKELNAKTEKLLDALEDGILDRDTIKVRMNKYKEEKGILEVKRAELKLANYDKVDEDKITAAMLKFKEDLITGDDMLKRKVIETFVEKIKIYPDRIDCTFKKNLIDALTKWQGIEVVEAERTSIYPLPC